MNAQCIKEAPWLLASVEGKFQRIARAEIQRETVRDLPFIPRKEFRDMGALLERLILNVDAESVHSAQ